VGWRSEKGQWWREPGSSLGTALLDVAASSLEDAWKVTAADRQEMMMGGTLRKRERQVQQHEQKRSASKGIMLHHGIRRPRCTVVHGQFWGGDGAL
jgi:hypothetical protein